MGKDEMELTEALAQTAENTFGKVATAPPTQKAVPRKKLIGGHFDKAVHDQLRLMSFDEDRSIQSLLGEALNYLFEKKGKPTIALGKQTSK